MKMKPRKFNDGDAVFAGPLKYKMIIVGATETLSGWRYALRFITKKDGTARKNGERRHFNEDVIKPLIPTP